MDIGVILKIFVNRLYKIQRRSLMEVFNGKLYYYCMMF